ncbi:hypothetical protein CPC08DRAFT_763170 [Agrocybe pediades]|nr:hypothetical protein CPC08DRAFT_763170 [Agrocybe pediades]
MEKEMGTKSLVYDEIKAGKRIRWDPKTNYFLGVRQEHASKTFMELINEGDMEELFRNIDEDKVHSTLRPQSAAAYEPEPPSQQDHLSFLYLSR